MRIPVKYDGKYLIPVYDSGYEKKKRLKIGKVYMAEVKQDRHIKHHRKFFALLSLLFDNQEMTDDFEIFRSAILIESGLSESVINKKTGVVTVVPKSISFSNMDQLEFEEVYQKVHVYACKAFDLPDDIEAELINFM